MNMNLDYVIYIIDDEKHVRQGIAASIDEEYTIRTFATAEEAIEQLTVDAPDLILLDIGLPGMSGLEALEKIKAINSEIVVIMITAYEDVNTVISAMKLGAYDYVVKPIQLEAIEIAIRNGLGTVSLRKEVRALQEASLKENLPFFISESESIQGIMEFISNVARSPDTPVLILGETGTGKELIARAIHHRSPNFQGPLVSVNCSAIPQDLIESELFGYEPGAFSGAAPKGKTGLIESAEGGTLFLDELGDLSLNAQAKLLRFLESGEFYKVGGSMVTKISTRVVSATNKNLSSMIAENLFRSDLYYRLSVVDVRIPPLKNRKKDILPLTKYFIDMFSEKFSIPFETLSEEAELWLLNHDWPGNIRELRNRVERSVLTGTPPVITVQDVSPMDTRDAKQDSACDGDLYFPSEGIDFTAFMDQIKNNYIKTALERAKGNEAKAARLLKLNHHTFRYHYKKIKENE